LIRKEGKLVILKVAIRKKSKRGILDKTRQKIDFFFEF